LLCKVCSKVFSPKRKDAKFCSAKCRVTNKRNKTVTDKSVTDNVSVSVTDNSKDTWLCKVDGCNLPNMPGHGNMCIYHWKVSMGLSHTSDKEYEKLNV